MKASAKTLRKKADRLWSQAVRARGYCERCGKRPPEVNLQGAHIIPRRYLKTRWDISNGLSLCAADHVYFTHFPLQFEDWVIAYIGEEKFRALRRQALDTVGKVDYHEVIATLEEVAA